MPIQIDYNKDMTTTDRVEKVIRQWQKGYISLPEMIEFLTEIDYLTTLDAIVERGTFF